MKMKYDQKTDAVYIELAGGVYDVSIRVSDSIMVDEDKKGKILGIEILDATKNITKFDPQKISLQAS